MFLHTLISPFYLSYYIFHIFTSSLGIHTRMFLHTLISPFYFSYYISPIFTSSLGIHMFLHTHIFLFYSISISMFSHNSSLQGQYIFPEFKICFTCTHILQFFLFQPLTSCSFLLNLFSSHNYAKIYQPFTSSVIPPHFYL